MPEVNISCEWTVVPPQAAVPAIFLDENAEAANYLIRKLPASEVAPLILTKSVPVYPPIARAAHVAGPVVIRLIVAGNGTVLLTTLVSGNAMLVSSALDAAKHWTFRGLQVGSQATPYITMLRANFQIEPNVSEMTIITMQPD